MYEKNKDMLAWLTRQLYGVVLLTFVKVGRGAVVIGVGAVGVALEVQREHSCDRNVLRKQTPPTSQLPPDPAAPDLTPGLPPL